MEQPSETIASRELRGGQRVLAAVVLFSSVLAVGFVLIELSDTHFFSSILYSANILAFMFAAFRVGTAVHHRFQTLLGHKLAMALGILVGLVIVAVLIISFNKMGHDLVHHYFEEQDDAS